MRISTEQMQSMATSAILDQQAKVSKSQMQLATGRRVLVPSDDPRAAAGVLGLDQAISQTNQYQSNSDTAMARLNLEDSTLGGVVNLLQRAHDLAVQGNNGTLTGDQRTAIASEVRQILDSVLGLANTKDANGEYIFAGLKSRQVPFSDNGAGVVSYAGDQGQRQLQIGPARQVAEGDPGNEVFLNIPNSSENAFSALNTLATDMEANTPNPATIDDIEAVMQNLMNVRAKVGGRQNAIEAQKNLNDSQVLQFQQSKSSLQDLDYAKAVTRLNLQLTGLQAAQQSYTRIQGLSLFNYLR